MPEDNKEWKASRRSSARSILPRRRAWWSLSIAFVIILLYLVFGSSQSAMGKPNSINKPRIAIVCFQTHETSYDWMAYSNKYIYARKHGYDLIFDFEGEGGTYCKIDMLQREIRTQNYDWLWWIDYDTLITNYTVKLKDIIHEAIHSTDHPDDIHQILTSDCFPLNTGSMVYKSTSWSLSFLTAAQDLRKKNLAADIHHSEQDDMRDLLAEDSLGAVEKTVFVEQWKMNAFPEEIKCFDKAQRGWEKGMFLVHFAGAWAHVKEPDPVKFLMRKYWPLAVR